MALRKVNNVTVKRASIGSFWRPKPGYEFQAPTRGSQYWYRRVSEEWYQYMYERQQSEPVLVLDTEGRNWWWYQHEFYHENDGYTSEDVKLILWDREQKKTRRIQRLRKEMLSQEALEEARRQQIPEDVRIFVWRRDQGKCARCGSQQNLEYDHIIPVSQGGSSTARNIQLLCERCNREKSDAV
jgi:5-methylcytosine-specific restriction endonuclease McrA